MAFNKKVLPICPQCKEERLITIESRASILSTRRRRKCDACGFRSTTHEVSAEFFEQAKQNQTIVLQLHKLLGGEPLPLAIEETKCPDCIHNKNNQCLFNFPEYNTSETYDCNQFEL
jgi:hypothetical protein